MMPLKRSSEKTLRIVLNYDGDPIRVFSTNVPGHDEILIEQTDNVADYLSRTEGKDPDKFSKERTSRLERTFYNLF